MNRRKFILSGAAAVGAGLLDLSLPQWALAAENGVLNIVLQPEPPGLMLAIVQNGPTQMISGNIYEGLFRYDEKLNPIPNLATDWAVSDDYLTYTFHIKQGVKWHDGKPFGVDDVIFTTTKFLPEVHARFRTNMQHIESITAPDEKTVVFKLKEPFGPFMQIFEVSSMPMVPKHVYEGTDFRSNPTNNTPIGTGAFKFKEWRRGSYIQLVKNQDYHIKDLPLIDTVYFQVIPDAASRAVAFESGKIDVLPGGSVEYFDVPRLAKLPNVEVTEKGWEFFAPHAFMYVNNRNPVLAKKQVRQAIMYALNRQAMVDVVFQGYGKVAVSPINSATKYFSDNVKKYPYDPEKAKALLKEAGYKNEKLTLLPLPYGETWQRVAEMTRQNLGKAGFNISVEALDVPTRNTRIENWDFDLTFTYMYQYGDPALGVSRNYLTSAIRKGSVFNNVEGYSNPEVDKLFAQGARESDPKKRAAIYEKVQQILVEDAPCTWLVELSFPTIYRSNVKDIVDSAIGINDGLARARKV